MVALEPATPPRSGLFVLSARLRSQGKPYATLRHKHGGGPTAGSVKLVLDRLRRSEGAILLLLFAAVVVAAVRSGRWE